MAAGSTPAIRWRSRTWRGQDAAAAEPLDAVAALEADAVLPRRPSESRSSTTCALKEFEFGRFLTHVTDWEHREYFEVY